ncbi:hypothetical protein BEP19_03415 [Ammoniphilus oxalaticus]|uniref:Uncharacterized protein n=1 Tax=Ammoniphilus oxalaticus TaxID=66863 RepID=A0A419SNZ3_9BACL|nr:hypothetical protein [Ammoniphilus oxalaticus]RKD25987.1 hypothetical protein BEP19_03415 [Ammoniphilus oxalaticus]
MKNNDVYVVMQIFSISKNTILTFARFAMPGRKRSVVIRIVCIVCVVPISLFLEGVDNLLKK